ncbi:PA2169 family four-helix-bundle protein [Luteolibacter sp. LG18]|uniref:PA2169 family four-helix-bundle protein n=1 Tax=Luteolibacter sp. LG18 TaxID=2819286 RepID=UPI002B2F65F9|nr:hypothetical protein llg_33580 [Luteolibacter sp. LG18]
MDPSTILQDAEALQEVLTRYVDSRDGYLQASEIVADEGLTRTFHHIADRRERIAGRIAELLHSDGQRPDTTGSTEAGVHRWWIRMRDKLSEHEPSAVVEECLRGEKELSRTLHSVAESGNLTPAHAPLVAEAISEVDLAIRAFELMVDDA